VSKQRNLTYITGGYNTSFIHKNSVINYQLKYEDSVVVREKLLVDKEIKLERGITGKGKIFAQKLNKFIEFKIPQNEVAILAKRDSMQHPFSEDIFNWGNNLMYFSFSSQLGKNKFLFSTDNISDTE
jgi:hypothetical protein